MVILSTGKEWKEVLPRNTSGKIIVTSFLENSLALKKCLDMLLYNHYTSNDRA